LRGLTARDDAFGVVALPSLGDALERLDDQAEPLALRREPVLDPRRAGIEDALLQDACLFKLGEPSSDRPVAVPGTETKVSLAAYLQAQITLVPGTSR
jgi:hypothetical protein